MCSFLIVSWVLQNLSLINTFLKARGPDGTYLYRHPYSKAAEALLAGTGSSSAVAPQSPWVPEVRWQVLFNHLHLTGRETPQPFRSTDGRYIASFNGEIYNWVDLAKNELREETSGASGGTGPVRVESDGDVIIPMYRKYGASFVKHLDGEFGIIVLDLEKRQIVLATDIFGTKPLYFSVFPVEVSQEEGCKRASPGNDEKRYSYQFGASIYRSGLSRAGAPGYSIQMVKPNTVLVFEYEFLKASTGECGVSREEVDLFEREHREKLGTASAESIFSKSTMDTFINKVFQRPKPLSEVQKPVEEEDGSDPQRYLKSKLDSETSPLLNGANIELKEPTVGMRSVRLVDSFSVYEFDLRQFKDSTDDAITAFENALEKRVKTSLHPPFIGLSAGYDAGAIHLALTNRKTPHYFYTIMGVEDMKVIERRYEFSKGNARSIIIDYSYNFFQEFG